jgi:Ca2+-binding EF-hand superfamily protein
MSFNDAEKEEFRTQFDLFDVDRNGSITALELQQVLKAVGEHVCFYLLLYISFYIT